MLKASKWTCRLPKSDFKTFFLEANLCPSYMLSSKNIDKKNEKEYYSSFFIRPCKLSYEQVLSLLERRSTGTLYLHECCTHFDKIDKHGREDYNMMMTLPEFLLEYTLNAFNDNVSIDFIIISDNEYKRENIIDMHTKKEFPFV